MTPFLIDWIDRNDRRSKADVIAGMGARFETARQSGWIVEAGTLHNVPCPACQSGHTASISFRDAGPMVYCAIEGWFDADMDAVTAMRLDLAHLAFTLGAALSCDAGTVVWRVADRLAELGTIEVRGTLRTLFFARGLNHNDSVDGAVSVLDTKGSQYAGLVLTTSQVPLELRTRWGHRFVPIENLVSLDRTGFALDRSAVNNWSAGLPKRARSRKRETGDGWRQRAELAWQHLHDHGQLGPNASEMGCKVRRLLGEWYPDMAYVPSHKTISDHLRPLHRESYPNVSRPSR